MSINLVLLAHTPNPEEVVTLGGKLCYSKVGVNELKEKQTPEDIARFTNMLAEIGHESPLEHCVFTFGVEGISRSCSHQIVRHRIASFCLSGDTVIGYDNRIKGMTIKELYNKPEQYRNMTKLRSVDEGSREIIMNDVVGVTYSGKKDLYEVVTEDGYKIKSTMKHRFFTNNGWKRLEDIEVGDVVYTNGIEAYKSKEWLYNKYVIENLRQEDIAQLCEVSKHTIRSWVKKFKLQKEPGSWSIGVEPPNKGKTKDNYEPLQSVSEKMKGNINGFYFGEGHHSKKKNEDLTRSGGYSRIHRDFIYKRICSICGEEGYTEVHHIDMNPKNDREENLIELCETCHKRQHKGMSVKAVKPSVVKSITHIGCEDTYDIEMKAPHHNFIADGFMVHNSQQSQRYVNLKDKFEYITPSRIKKVRYINQEFVKAMDNSFESYVKIARELLEYSIYEFLVEENKIYSPDTPMSILEKVMKSDKKFKKTYNAFTKMAIEDARAVLPNACETKMVFTMNARTLLNFFHKRDCNRSQEEIRELARLMIAEVQKVAPSLFSKCGADCRYGKCGEGHMCCGSPLPKWENA